MKEDHCGNVHRQYYGRSDKANAWENQNADFQAGYAWGIETFAYGSDKVITGELDFRAEFRLSTNGFSEWKRGLWAARGHMGAAGIKKKPIYGAPLE
jgi:hypothetical protein